jgi:multidrug efflux pump subunit AcrA (membrane-fusion protein)
MIYRGCGYVACLTLALCTSGCGRNDGLANVKLDAPEALQVEVVSVERSRIETSIELVGTLYPWKFATIASEVTGVIEMIPESGEKIEYEYGGQAYSKSLPLDIGHEVSRGDVLIKINSMEAEHAVHLAAARLALVESELANLFAWKRSEEVDQSAAECEEYEAILEDAEADLARAKVLVERNAISKREVDDAGRSVATARAGLKRAKAALKLAEAGPTAEQIEVAKAQVAAAKAELADKNATLKKCTICCPLETGVIVERYVGVGDHVTANPSTPLMRVVDSSILLAQVHVPGRYQGLIHPEDVAWVYAEGVRETEATNGEIEARVVLVNAQIDPDTRTFRIRVGIENIQNELKAGTFVKVRVPLRSVAETVIVPAEAIAFSKGEPAAYVVRDGVIEKRPVVLGISNRSHFQIVSGLTEQDQIVKGDLSLLADGLRVQPKPTTSNMNDSQG